MRWQGMFQSAATVVGLGHLAVFLAYLFMYGIPDDLMVSDIIFDYHGYRDAMTAFNALEFAVTLCYTARIYAVDPLGSCLTAYWVVFGFAGWCTLAYNQDTPRHFLGVGIFVSGSAFGWILILCQTKPQRKNLRAYDYAVYACILVTFGLTGEFLVMYKDGSLPGCWLVEQLALCFYIVSFTAFFSRHSFDPRLSFAQEAAVAPAEYHHVRFDLLAPPQIIGEYRPM